MIIIILIIIVIMIIVILIVINSYIIIKDDENNAQNKNNKNILKSQYEWSFLKITIAITKNTYRKKTATKNKKKQ